MSVSRTIVRGTIIVTVVMTGGCKSKPAPETMCSSAATSEALTAKIAEQGRDQAEILASRFGTNELTAKPIADFNPAAIKRFVAFRSPTVAGFDATLHKASCRISMDVQAPKGLGQGYANLFQALQPSRKGADALTFPILYAAQSAADGSGIVVDIDNGPRISGMVLDMHVYRSMQADIEARMQPKPR